MFRIWCLGFRIAVSEVALALSCLAMTERDVILSVVKNLTLLILMLTWSTLVGNIMN